MTQFKWQGRMAGKDAMESSTNGLALAGRQAYSRKRAPHLYCIQAKPGPVTWRPEAAASDVEMAMMYYARARRIRVACLSSVCIFFLVIPIQFVS